MEKYQLIVLGVVLALSAIFLGYVLTGAYKATYGLVGLIGVVLIVAIGGGAWAFHALRTME